MVFRRLFKNGGSVVVSIPGHVLEALGVEVGDYLGMELASGRWLRVTGVSEKEVVEEFQRDREREAERSQLVGGGGGGGRA
jgi:antitoxin component of MazEF toxin-antitoxin module